MNCTFIKKAFDIIEYKAPKKKGFLSFEDVTPDEPTPYDLDQGLTNAISTVGGIYGAKYLPRWGLHVVSPEYGKKYKDFWNWGTKRLPYIGRLPKGRTTAIAGLLGALAGTSGLFRGGKERKFEMESAVEDLLEKNKPTLSDDTKNIIKQIGLGAGGAGLGYLAGNLFDDSGSKLLPTALALLGGAAGLGYANKDKLLS